jgi:hypothetical protein
VTDNSRLNTRDATGRVVGSCVSLLFPDVLLLPVIPYSPLYRFMAPKPPCAKYQYVVTSAGPKILPVDETAYKDEESPADYNAGGYLPVKVNDTFKQGRYRVVRKLGCVLYLCLQEDDGSKHVIMTP